MTDSPTEQQLHGEIWAIISGNDKSPRVHAILDEEFRDLLVLFDTYAARRADEASRLTKFLHSKRMHPDYEYDTVVEGRKQGDGHPPEGDSWEINKDYNDGFERFDFTEETYWRRLNHKEPKV